MRVLLGTNQLQKIAGSELLLSDFAAHCQAAGADVTVFTNWDGWPMSKNLQKAGLPVVSEPADVRPLDYDLVYFQHQLAGLFDYEPRPSNAQQSLFVFAKLSPVGFFESAGWELERALGDLIFANSFETAEAVQAQGNELPIRIFHNAVSVGGVRPRKGTLPTRPRRVLLVGSRPDAGLIEALRLIGEGIQVDHMERSGDLAEAGAALKVREADLVIGIGKTVLHALVARLPVYVYDHAGGPGYLSEANFEKAAQSNFSGRCTPQLRTASALARDIVGSYEAAARFTAAMQPEISDRYVLSRHFDALLQTPRTSNEERRARLAMMGGAVQRERRLAEFVRSTYRKSQMVARSVKSQSKD